VNNLKAVNQYADFNASLQFVQLWGMWKRAIKELILLLKRENCWDLINKFIDKFKQ